MIGCHSMTTRRLDAMKLHHKQKSRGASLTDQMYMGSHVEKEVKLEMEAEVPRQASSRLSRSVARTRG